MKQTNKVIAIVGPTASGKTSLSIELAKRLDGEIINGDAMQVYKELNIGTAKITDDEKEGIPHHLFDIKEPTESFSVAEYQSAVRSCIEDIRSRDKQPIIVGGTGLYIQSVLFDFRFTEEAGDEKIRAELEKELELEGGAERLYNRLQKIDPVSAEKIHPNNHRRLVRALEIIEVTGKTKNEHEQGAGEEPLYDHLIVGLTLDRELLYERINQRVDQMMNDGLLEEARGLWNKGVRNVQSVQAIGYKELYEHFEGLITLDEAVDLIKKNTRHYAKRQMTYFRNKVNISWFDALLNKEKIVDGILSILKGFEEAKSNK
ncbi:tRNA (adenosine(37)-N6)-dimethylallyltransferase MiaA [Sporosarcina sp. ACRSL]|uniref:tRNA (adenosine(37)-N6)-dimethylallyltransferase MiaA n=1 Tax=Sporosarcina sp. ACRSL TaxID=2918215 RepID=UPI001EF5CFCE|nr:tRNA (adenosine(37)-N6)-dimethylallyltransferase MiaA [Sporosarcina sp. ACRSL]MCG7342949.1 tRNA (adenosine(37)-N6)-dimethylallyltransferase MiaA [Sporosarcina sp. ACRSL]